MCLPFGDMGVSSNFWASGVTQHLHPEQPLNTFEHLLGSYVPLKSHTQSTGWIYIQFLITVWWL